MSASATTGTAERWGPLWGAYATDWAVVEEQQIETYEEAIRRLGIWAGRRVLDIGCGSGVFLRAAADRGADVSGIDASEELIAIARGRVPEGELRVGELQSLPYDDDAFDVVTGFNSFFFAADMVAALREAGRVAAPGAPVLIQVWGRPDRCDLDAIHPVLGRFLPPPDPNAVRGSALWEPGLLEQLAGEAGLEPEGTFDVSWAYGFADDEALYLALTSAGGVRHAIGPERGDEALRTLVDALAHRRDAGGAYRLENEWHYLVARAPD